MSPRIRLVLFGIAGVAIGIVIGVDIANESYGWAVLAGLICCWLLISRMSEAKIDSWLLAVTLIGYIVGNRGFAQLQPAEQIPLLPAEAVLLVAVPTLIYRMFLRQTSGVRRDSL